MLQGNWSGQTLLFLAFRTLFVMERGYLIIDDRVIPKPFANAIEGLAWGYSTKDRKSALGLSIVLLVGTHGVLRLPWGFRLWQKGGASKYDLALELLSYARNRLKCRPEYVLFDAWYPSKQLLKRIRDYSGYFICQIKKNRHFNGQPVKRHRLHPYWTDVGVLSGGLKVRVVRHGKKYYATNRLTLSAPEVRQLYRIRWQVEEVIKGVQRSTRALGLSSSVPSSTNPSPHVLLGCVLYIGKGTP